MENPGYCTGSFDGLHHPSDDDDDEMVDIAGATLDFSTTDDVPPLSSGNCTHTVSKVKVHSQLLPKSDVQRTKKEAFEMSRLYLQLIQSCMQP